jgi:hypothetical protein
MLQLKEDFVDREDRLQYRSATFSIPEGSSLLDTRYSTESISKITEKYRPADGSSSMSMKKI